MKVAIVEDNNQERLLLREYLNRYDKGIIIDSFSSAVDFLTNYQPCYDVIFMDIEMPYLDGMSAAAKLRELDHSVCLVFVTNFVKFAVKGYEVSAFEFIVKPINYANFALKMSRICNHLSTKTQKSILIHSGHDLVRVPILSIQYVEIMSHKIIYHTIDKQILSYGTLKNVEELLNDKLFVKCNNCYLVNLRSVQGIENGCVVVGSDKLKISYPRKLAFETALADYLCGELS